MIMLRIATTTTIIIIVRVINNNIDISINHTNIKLIKKKHDQ